MNFAKLFHKSNSSIHQLQGNVLECTIEQIRGNRVTLDTGMRSSFVCFVDELIHRARGHTKTFNSYVIGVEDKRSIMSGEFNCAAPKSMEKTSRRKLVWTELTKLWRAGVKNRMKGFILNSVNGGYAVAISGYIAFLPKSLCLNKKVFIGQSRQFAIIGMNPKIANIVVKEIKPNMTPLVRTKIKAQSNRKFSRPALGVVRTLKE